MSQQCNHSLQDVMTESEILVRIRFHIKPPPLRNQAAQRNSIWVPTLALRWVCPFPIENSIRYSTLGNWVAPFVLYDSLLVRNSRFFCQISHELFLSNLFPMIENRLLKKTQFSFQFLAFLDGNWCSLPIQDQICVPSRVQPFGSEDEPFRSRVSL